MIDLINNIDSGIMFFIQEYIRSPILSAIFVPLTKSGDGGILLMVIGIILVIIKKTRQAGIVFLISLAASYLVNDLVLKNIFERDRPFVGIEGLDILTKKPVSFSFPSGHTATTFACAVSLLCMRVKYAPLALVYAILMGFSRVYVGVHYPTDVLFGAIVGIITANTVVFLFKRIKKMN